MCKINKNLSTWLFYLKVTRDTASYTADIDWVWSELDGRTDNVITTGISSGALINVAFLYNFIETTIISLSKT